MRDVRSRDDQGEPTKSTCCLNANAGTIPWGKGGKVMLFSGVDRSQHSILIRSVICEKDEGGLGEEKALRSHPYNSDFPNQGITCSSQRPRLTYDSFIWICNTVPTFLT